jgi:hypothetical protein
MTLEDMLNDAQIADDLEVSFGDKGTFKVGDLRAVENSRKSKLSAGEKKLKEQMDLVTAKQKELTDLADEAVRLSERLKAEPVKSADGEIDFSTDPLYAPLFTKQIKPLADKYTVVENQLKQLTNTLTDIARIGLADRLERRFERIPEDKRPKDKTWKDYVKLATEKKILDEFGIPDPLEAWNREMAPVVQSELEKQNLELKKQVDELTKAASTPRMPRPGASGAPKGAVDNKGKTFDSVDALVDAAFADPMIQDIAGRA